MSLILKSREQLAGDIVRALVGQTDITDVSVGSSLAILIESIASVQFQIQMKIMKILEASNIDALVGVALDNKARSLGLPNGIGGLGRMPATKSSGNVTVGSGFVKISTKSYAGKPSPYAGSTLLYVENASSFPSTGSVYIGRGTADRFEGPIPYISVTNNVSYWTIALKSPMTKSHIYSDLVTLAQGGDRNINVGQSVNTRALQGSPSVSFTSTATITLPDGESSISVPVVCTQFGQIGDVLAGSITQFGALPFSGATVTNPVAFVNGQPSESDEDLRKRIKDFPSLLSKGTARAIEAAIVGASDQATGKTLLSSSVVEATIPGEISDIYIDDGTGLEPTFVPQPYELLIESALGIEKNLELSQVPVTPCIAVGVNEGPFILNDGTSVGTPIDSISVVIDGVLETYNITPDNYASLQSATCYELVRDFNGNPANSRTAWRTINGGNSLVCFDSTGEAGMIQIQSSPLQIKLGLPTSEIRSLYLYEDGVLLSDTGLTASITTTPINSWTTALTAIGGIHSFVASLLVGEVAQTVTISDTDFAPLGTTILTAVLSDWISVFKKKFAGVSFSVSSSGSVIGNQLVFTAQETNSSDSILQVLPGDPAWSGAGGIMDPASVKQSSIGQSKDYDFNRMTGDIQFVNNPTVGARIEAGTRNTRAEVLSTKTTTGNFSLNNVSPGIGLSQMVVTFDDNNASAIATPSISPTDTVTLSLRSDNFVTMTFSNSTFYADLIANGLGIGSYFLLVMDSSVGPSWGNVGGIYRIKVKNDSTHAISFEVSPNEEAAFALLFGTPLLIAPSMFMAFNCEDSLPQLVSFTANETGSIEIDTLVSDINAQIFGGTAEKINPDQLVIRSNRFSDLYGNRVASILAVSGSIAAIFSTGSATGIQAHVASSESMQAGGAAPVISAIVPSGSYSTGHAWRSYLKTQRIMTDVTNLGSSPIAISDYQSQNDTYPKGCEHLWTSGRNVGYEGRCYNIGTSGGFSGVMSSSGVRPIFETSSIQASGTGLDDYRNFGIRVQDLGISSSDKLVVVLDQDSQDKTISVAMGKRAVIQDINAIPSDGQPQTIQFRLQDPDDANLPFFDNTSIFKSFDFSDFNMLTKSVGLVRNFSTYADIPRSSFVLPAYSITSGMMVGDSITINDGISTTESFSITGTDPYSITWSTGSVPIPPFAQATGSVQTLPVTSNNILPMTVVFTPSSTTITSASNHGLSVGDAVTFTTTGALPAAISVGSTYWVTTGATNTFSVASTYGGSPLTFLTAGTGVASFVPVGISDGNTITLNDGTNTSTVFEFDSNSLVAAGHIAVSFNPGSQASGSITFNPYSSSYFTAVTQTATCGVADNGVVTFPNAGLVINVGDYIQLASGFSSPVFDAYSIYYVYAATTSGFTIRASKYSTSGFPSGLSSSGPGTYIVNKLDTSHARHDDLIAINDGISVKTFQLWLSNASTTYAQPGSIPFFVSPSAFYFAENVSLLASSLSSSINTSGLNIISVPVGGTSGQSNLTNQRYRSYNNAISPTVVYASAYAFVGMSGGVNPDNATVLASALENAINGVGASLEITASVSGRNVNLTNDNEGSVGNQNIISSNVYVPFVSMSGGVDAPTASEMQVLFLNAINTYLSTSSMSLEAFASGTSGIDLLGSVAGAYTITVTPSVVHATIPVTSTPGNAMGAISSNALVFRSVKFGSPSRLAISIQYPLLPNQATVVVSHANYFDSTSFSPSQSCSFSSPSTVNSANHGLSVGDRIVLVSSDTLPLGLNENETYYVQSVSSGTFTLSASSVDASLAPVVTFTGSGTGTSSFIKLNSEFCASTTLNVSLKSGAASGGALFNTGSFTVATRFVDQYTRRLTFVSSALNQNLSYAVGNVLTVGGNNPDISGAYLITFADAGVVEVAAAGSVRVVSGTYSASLYPINTFPLIATTIQNVADAINSYNVNNPIATAQAIGAGVSSETITLPTYITSIQEYQGFDSDMPGAVSNHSQLSKLSGIANIYQYNSIDPSQNNIFALVQSHDSLFPNAIDSTGTSYSIVGEEVYLVPTNKVTASRWLNFVVSSSLSILSAIENVGIGGADLQISSDSDGSLGAVTISNSGANQSDSFLINNSSDIGDSTRSYVLSATADRFVRDNLVLVQNTLSTEIPRSYAVTWSGTGTVPTAEQQDISDYFRLTTAVKYEQVTTSLARFFFYRADMSSTPTISSGTVTVARVDVGLYSLTASGGGTFSARTGDICLFSPTSAFPSNWKYASAQDAVSVYPGHQVVAVLSNTEILLSVINDSGFSGAVSISSATDIVFAPAIWNEKNIFTNMKGGTEFSSPNTTLAGACWISYKKIGNNFLSVWLKNNTTEAADDMALNSALVSTDDFVYLPNDPNPHRLVAHNGRNNFIVYDPEGFDSLIDPFSATGTDYWLLPYTTPVSGDPRAIRILDGNSVKLGDNFRISSSTIPGATWFGASMLGNWSVTKIGWSQKIQGSMTMTMPTLGLITSIDGQNFSLSDGSLTSALPIVFEFNSSQSSVQTGHVWVQTSTNPNTLANTLVSVINGLFNTTFYRASAVGAVVTIVNTNLGKQGVFSHSPTFTPTYDTSLLDQSLTSSAALMVPYIEVSMPKCPRYVFDSTGTPVDHLLLGGNSGSLGFVEGTPLSVVRVVGGTAVDPLNVENSEIFLAPQRQSNKMNSSNGAQIVSMNKLGFDNLTHVGIDGYVSFSGLIAQAHKIIDGSDIDPVSYPGVRAAGTQIEVLPALIRSISVSLTVVTKDGVSLGSLTDSIKSTVASYINGLGIGDPVIISSIISIVQAIPGVSSVLVTGTLPVHDLGDESKISMKTPVERAYVLNSSTDITVG